MRLLPPVACASSHVNAKVMERTFNMVYERAMGNTRALFATTTTVITAAVTIVACGSDKAKPDAPVVLIDAPIDTPAIDAPPDAPAYDFSCFGSAGGSSAPATITIAGKTLEVTQSGSAALPSVAVDAYKTGVAAPLASTMSGSASSNAPGAFTLTVPTATAPLSGYVKAALSTYRTTYLFPPNPLIADLAMIPVIMVSDTNFDLLTSVVLMTTQDDTANGVVLVGAVDCQNNPINGATITVQQGGSDVGMPQDLSQFGFPGLAVLNVPDGDTEVGASYGGMTFPPHTVVAHKKANGSGGEGSLTITVVRPGP